MIEIIHYNSFKDIDIVYPGLSIDLDSALRTGVVKDLGVEVEYNGIEDPSLIRRRVTDTFDAIDERNSVVHKELTRIKSNDNTDSDSPNVSN